MAKLSLIGLYNYDSTLFDNLTFPEGIEKDIAVNEILMKSGEFELVYPSLNFIKSQITMWGRKHYRTFQKWLDALSIEYDPLYNYDRHEEYSDEEHKGSNYKTEADYNEDKTLDLEDKRTPDLTEQRTPDLSETRSPDLNEQTTYNTTDTTAQMQAAESERSVSAYDATGYSPSEKTETDNGIVDVTKSGTVDLDTTGTDTTTTTGTDTTTTTGTDTTTHSGTDKTNVKGKLSDVTGSENNYVTHDAHLYGNIGVTTSQQMLRDELDVQRWNIYEHIADIFVDEFCIQIY